MTCLWKWHFPLSPLKLRFSFNTCQDTLQDSMILPAFLSGGTSLTLVLFLAGVLDDGFVLGWEILTLACLGVS